ncbi:hypothetical protein P153DRAFT_292602 [Dothidotthia symphoricarpi CBS 119687]|uniref:SPT23/MGA2-like DNA-binding domain-containing protein n=1 Tax=Dothidotthia symphoricarpi CBS 119687 TaxID=1392245 RepID=A0A6A6ACR7_9PLEO|nr:uncharacterized protein P153DRAFT_292602 [Dothidotthia symphoricarpi CBS 119687]KAF2129043.1 hypothetical protein P153DRAFT_292602 [Dothidotthia symphoricarpi CBS 119687]
MSQGYSAFNPVSHQNIEDSVNLNERGTRNQDSAVDLRAFSPHQTYTRSKLDGHHNVDIDAFIQTSPSSQASNTSSPNADPSIFSNANSPRDFAQEHSQTNSPETTHAIPARQNTSRMSQSETPDAILIPQSINPPHMSTSFDKTRIRCETQIKASIHLDPLPDHVRFLRFPRPNVARIKQLATDAEARENEAHGSTVRLDICLVLATAVDSPDQMKLALRRARGEAKTHRRPAGVAISDISKDDVCHPVNGGAVLICDGCKAREAKRFERKKKRTQEEEDEWERYADERIITINEKEFKEVQEMNSSDPKFSPLAKKVDFALRIVCYCRHQEEKSPGGYRIIFTLRDTQENVLHQHMSEIIHITDDHKEKKSTEVISAPLLIQTQPTQPQQVFVPTQYASNVVPVYQYNTNAFDPYSQPTTPLLSQFQNSMVPGDLQFNRNVDLSGIPQTPYQAPLQVFSPTTIQASAIPTPAQTPTYASHQRHQSSYYNTPMMSPTDQVPPQVGYALHRPHSMDTFSQHFNYNYTQPSPSHHQTFASQPPSRATSRPASPSWDQGGTISKRMRTNTTFFVGDGFEE